MLTNNFYKLYLGHPSLGVAFVVGVSFVVGVAFFVDMAVAWSQPLPVLLSWRCRGLNCTGNSEELSEGRCG